VFTLVIIKNFIDIQKESKKPLAYMGDLINYDPETKKFQPVHFYLNPFDDDQKDVATIDAVTLQEKAKDKLYYEIEEEKEKGIEPEHNRLVFKEQEVIEALSLEEVRKIVYEEYEKLTKEAESDYKKRRIIDIVNDQKEQLISFYELSNLLIHRVDALEAENDGLKASLETAFDKLEEKEIRHAGVPDLEPKKKKLDFVHWLLLVLSGIFFIVMIVLIIVLATSSGGVV